ncbi:MAG TPA: DNA repair protein RecN [Fimbriimonadaceae bacterium]|nr:DNA repair protein RecN [Fimbriimonadaceae bacterium]
MIVELSVENLAIIDRAELGLGPGFTAMTGETGGGKSLLIDAVELALGGRADTDQVRSGAHRAVVELAVDVSSRPELLRRCSELGVPAEDGVIRIRREVLAEGKSQCRVGGKAIPVSALKTLGTYLVDLHGQHDHQSLLDPSRHIGYLDGWIGEPAALAVQAVATEFEAVQAIARKLNALRHGRRELEQRIDLLRYQLNEIDEAAPQLGETEDLEAQLERLRHAERLSSAASDAVLHLVDDENSAYDRAAVAVKGLDAVVKHDPELEPPLDELRDAVLQLQEAAHTLRGYAEGLDSDPKRLDAAEERLEVLRRLRRKYGDDEAAVLAFAVEARTELESLTFGADDEEALADQLSERESRLDAEASALTRLRREQATSFSRLVQEALRDLAMDRSVFEVDFTTAAIDASGADRVEFFFSANAGEPPRPLAKIASGGELSRVMLAIKSVYAGKAGVPTLIFDEVDAGLSGRAAAAVARKLEGLAEHYQVLVISHLPQIASRASRHFRIEKREKSGRAVTEVVELSPTEREREIARMLAGERVTDAALVNARELLGRATGN